MRRRKKEEVERRATAPLEALKSITIKEGFIDPRLCVISGCPLLRRAVTESGEQVYVCAAGIMAARVPALELQQELQENNVPIPGYNNGKDRLYRLASRTLLAEDCMRHECGVFYRERKILVDEGPLFD